MDTPDLNRFINEVRRTGVIGGHPDTLAALAAHPDFGVFGGVRLMSSPWFERGRLYSGDVIAQASNAAPGEGSGPSSRTGRGV